MRKKPATRLRQPTPQELLDGLLAFLQRKFYPGHPIPFKKDRQRLLDWVVLWPATWLDSRGVTIPADRYSEIFTRVFLDAQVFGTAEKITYLPAYLRKVIQSHFAVHGEEYYEEAKSMRSLVENAILMTGKRAPSAPDPVRELAAARRLLLTSKKRPVKPASQDQLSLL